MNILIFGSTGSIGNYLFTKFSELNYNVIGTTSNLIHTDNKLIYVNIDDNIDELLKINNLDGIVWAQGYNFNDNINTFNEDEFIKIINVNVLFILKTLNFLLKHNKINQNAKLVIISSIWEELSRDNKLSYSISKSALSGMVKNLSYDLSEKNILINNILPGVIDNDMTRKTLKQENIDYIEKYMKFNRLVDLNDIFNTTKFLLIDNTGITAQSIKVDLGFTNIKKYN